MRSRLLLTCVALAALVAGTLVVTAGFGFRVAKGWDEPFTWLTLALWPLFALAVWALRGVTGRAVTVLVLGGSVLLAGAALTGPPNTSTDSARYAWDGIVQREGVSPYRYTPADPELADLRPDWLYPDAVADDGELECPGPRTEPFAQPDGTIGCTTMNRPTVPTIYPPVAQAFFAGVRALVPDTVEYAPFQVAGAVIAVLTTALLLRVLRRRGLDPRWAALFGWCPLLATEGVTNSHVDLLAGLLALAAALLVSARRPVLGAIALGAAAATKFIPVIAAPALLRGQPWRIGLVAAATFVVVYVPYVLATGPAVLGYLSGYLDEEGYGSGSRFALFAFLPGFAATVVAAALVAIVGVLVWRGTDPAHPWVGQVVMVGATLAIVTPRYPWYALLLLPFVAMSGRWEWLAVALALSFRVIVPGDATARPAMIAAIVVVIAVSWWRGGPDAAGRIRRWSHDPLRVRGALARNRTRDATLHAS